MTIAIKSGDLRLCDLGDVYKWLDPGYVLLGNIDTRSAWANVTAAEEADLDVLAAAWGEV